ncbi:MAG: hypothetical protein HY901_04470 [Deltaproteobacteria bacterium]|nr:hypothetical protein [Deltaproteobacteria bacterium]
MGGDGRALLAAFPSPFSSPAEDRQAFAALLGNALDGPHCSQTAPGTLRRLLRRLQERAPEPEESTEQLVKALRGALRARRWWGLAAALAAALGGGLAFLLMR